MPLCTPLKIGLGVLHILLVSQVLIIDKAPKNLYLAHQQY